MATKGKLIVVEGLDGSGKTTQAERIFHYLSEPQNKLIFGYKGVHLTREPTSNLIGGLIRSQLSGDWRSSQECLQLLFAADRAFHLEKEVIPLLEKGIVVVSDRYFFSSLAYGALDLDDGWLREINRNFPLPFITFFLDVPPKICLRRIKRERFGMTLFEKEKELVKVRKNYIRLREHFKNFFIIDGRQGIAEVGEEIIRILNLKLSKI